MKEEDKLQRAPAQPEIEEYFPHTRAAVSRSHGRETRGMVMCMLSREPVQPILPTPLAMQSTDVEVQSKAEEQLQRSQERQEA